MQIIGRKRGALVSGGNIDDEKQQELFQKTLEVVNQEKLVQKNHKGDKMDFIEEKRY